MKKMKIRDLPKNFDMIGCKLNGQYIYSGWNKGFWVKNKMSDGEVFPIFFKNWEEIKEWEIEVPLGRVIEIESEQPLK